MAELMCNYKILKLLLSHTINFYMYILSFLLSVLVLLDMNEVKDSTKM